LHIFLLVSQSIIHYGLNLLEKFAMVGCDVQQWHVSPKLDFPGLTTIRGPEIRTIAEIAQPLAQSQDLSLKSGPNWDIAKISIPNFGKHF
jgi:hypothetical protein